MAAPADEIEAKGKPMRQSMKGIAIGILVMSGLAGCAAHPEPIVDTKGVTMSAYEKDLAECSVYADQIQTEKGVAKGAATGAISGNAADGAGYGSIWGATRSGLDADEAKQGVVKQCLRGRGYKVLN
jgi:outer membrane lipoprotein SlyB